jgi:predicted ATP-dependent endonuclease of OLD family
MRKIAILGLILCMSSGLLFFAGCAQKSGSVSEAIQNSQALQSIKEKADYLVKQAQAFYNSKEYQQAIEVAQYILGKLDSNSQQAKSLIENAKAQLQAAAQKAAGDVTNKLLGK